MPMQDFKALNDFFKQLIMKRVEKASAPQDTTVPQLTPSTQVRDLGPRPQMTKPKMELEFKGTTNPWSSLLVALGLKNQMANNLGRENELAAQGDYSAKLKSGMDMDEDQMKKQRQLEVDVVDPNKVVDRDYKDSVTTQNAWENFLKSEMAPLDIQKKQVDIAAAQDRMARAAAGGSGGGRPLTAGQQAEQARATTINGIFNELVNSYVTDKSQVGGPNGEVRDNGFRKEDMTTAELSDLYQKAVLLSGDPKYASRVKGSKSSDTTKEKRYQDSLALRINQDKRSQAKFEADAKKRADKEKLANEIVAGKEILRDVAEAVPSSGVLPNQYRSGGKTLTKAQAEAEVRNILKSRNPNLSPTAIDDIIKKTVK